MSLSLLAAAVVAVLMDVASMPEQVVVVEWLLHRTSL
jgi:hypothetical protein